MALPPLRKKPPREKITKDGIRRRSPAHRNWVRKFCCIVSHCERTDIECAHVRSDTDGSTGDKPSDWWTVSMCSAHHRYQHQAGEPAFEKMFGLDLKALATEFAQKSPVQWIRNNAGGKYWEIGEAQ